MIDHYLATALRNARRTPFLTAVNVLTLALGLICFVSAYAVVDYWHKSERQFTNAERTVVIQDGFEFHDGSVAVSAIPYAPLPAAEYLEQDFPALEAVARAVPASETAISAGDRSLRVRRLLAEPGFLEIFDLPFVEGDSATALARPRSVVLTRETAQRLFSGEDPVGKPVVIANQVDATVTGVIGPIPEPSHLAASAGAPMRFDFLGSFDIVGEIQRTRNPNRPWPPPENWIGGCCVTYALLPADGSLTLGQLTAGLPGFVQRHIPPQQAQVADVEMSAIPVSELSVANLNATLFQGSAGAVSITVLLLLLAGLILTVACINYANLGAASAARRAREVGLRKVIGAAKRQVMLQYLLEAGLQSAAAVLVAFIGLWLLVPVLASKVGIDLAVSMFSGASFWVFLALLVVAVTLLAGAYPAFVLARVRPIEALRAGRARTGPRFVATLLVGTQFAAASFLLIAVLVVFAQNSELERTGLGATADPLLMIDNPSRLTGVTSDTLRAELLRLPQVEAVTASATRPWNVGAPVNLITTSPDPDAPAHKVTQASVAADYFEVFDMKILAGRVFDRNRAEDLPPEKGATPSTINIVVDDAFVHEFGLGTPEDALGKLVYYPARLVKAFDNDKPPPPMRIIGVVESKPLHFVGLGATSTMYRFGTDIENEIARLSASDVAGGVAAIETLWKRLSPHMPLGRYFVDDLFNQSYRTFARINQVFVGLSLFAFFISTVGLFALAIQVASRRVQEIGVRKTLGASTGQIVRMLLRDFSRPVVIANVVAWPLAYVLAKTYLGLFIHRVALTPLPFVAALLFAVGIAWAAVGAQAYRAARVEPARVLRSE